jgi:hypothetical protein
MSVLRDNLKNCINAFQQLLDEYPDDDKALVKAAKEKWPDKNDVRRNLVIANQIAGGLRIGTEKGGPNPDDDDNTLTGKLPNSTGEPPVI